MNTMNLQLLPIDQVELDISNPRIAKSLEMYGDNITSEDIALALSGGSGDGSTSYYGLFESIKVNKGIINPIIVNHHDGKYTVVEGNTRVQIYKELRKSDSSGNWDCIQALVYEGMTDSEIHEIRLQAHLVGPRNWSPFSKSKYLYELSEKQLMPLETIVSLCGGKEKKSEIQKSISAYKNMMEYYKPLTDTGEQFFDPQDFSYFMELQNGVVRDALSFSGSNITDFSTWVLDKKLVNAQNVRKLPKVLQNKKAAEIFMKSGMTEALKYVSITEQSSVSLANVSFDDLLIELKARIAAYSYDDLKRLRNADSCASQREHLLDLQSELNTFVAEFEEV